MPPGSVYARCDVPRNCMLEYYGGPGARAQYALAAAKGLYGIRGFRFYAVADGMKRPLGGSPGPFDGRKQPVLQEMQFLLVGL